MKLPNYLFWDIDIADLDFEKNARFVIHRVITRGSLKDWRTIKDFYGINFIKREILQMRNLDAKSLNFFSILFGIEKKKFRCFSIQQSIPSPFNS